MSLFEYSGLYRHNLAENVVYDGDIVNRDDLQRDDRM